MYNFSEFCKEKQCEHYREWSVQAGKDGMVRCCNLVGMSFYIIKFPDNCIHLEEITARMKYEKEKHDAWKQLSDTKTSIQKRQGDWSSGIPITNKGYPKL